MPTVVQLVLPIHIQPVATLARSEFLPLFFEFC